MPMTVDGGQRVVMPAKYTAQWPASVLWPRGQFFLASTPFGLEERGFTPKQNFTGRDGAFGADYSWLGNLPTGTRIEYTVSNHVLSTPPLISSLTLFAGNDFFMRLCDAADATTEGIPPHCAAVPVRS